VEVTDCDEHSSLIQYRTNYGCKKHYDKGAPGVNVIKLFFLVADDEAK
jgi:hypothetical protein